MKKFHEAEIAHIEETLRSAGYELIVQYLHDHAARLTTALANDTSTWEDVLKYRGELQGIARFHPDQIRKNYPNQSEKP